MAPGSLGQGRSKGPWPWKGGHSCRPGPASAEDWLTLCKVRKRMCPAGTSWPCSVHLQQSVSTEPLAPVKVADGQLEAASEISGHPQARALAGTSFFRVKLTEPRNQKQKISEPMEQAFRIARISLVQSPKIRPTVICVPEPPRRHQATVRAGDLSLNSLS